MTLCYQTNNNASCHEEWKQGPNYKLGSFLTGYRHLQNSSQMNSNSETMETQKEQLLMYLPRKYSTGSHPYVYRINRINSPVGSLHNGGASRRASVATSAAHHYSRNRMGRRGSEVPALSSLARLRKISNPPSYPVGLKRRGSRGFSNADFQISTIQAKAKNEMLANLVLPVLSDTPAILRERRITCHYYSPSLVKSKKDEKRLRVAREILDTEKTYLASLTTLQKVFEEPLRASGLISQKEMDIVFPKELEHIRLSHTLFMKDLEERIQNWKLQGIVGDIFTKLSSSYHIDVLRIYSTYVNNFPKAIAVINKCCRNSHKLRKFLQSCSVHHKCEGLDLPAFLLTPIQRLPRYVLLLRQMNKNTETSHPDSFHINSALENMTQMINVLNDSIQNSCKLAYSSTLQKNVKRRKSRKRTILRAAHQSMKDSQPQALSSKLSDDLNQGSLSAISGTSVEAAAHNSLVADSKGRNETYFESIEERLSPPPSPSASNSVELRETNKEGKPRPLSSGGESSDVLSENENPSEFATIAEESPDENRENLDKATSKFRAAAGNMLNNWIRKSKRWRKSFDGDSEKNVIDELDTQFAKATNKKNGTEESVETTDAAQATLTQTCLLKERIQVTTTNVDTLADSLSKNNSQNILCPQEISERPQSLLLFSNHSTNLDKEDLKNRALSEGDITEGNSKLPSPVWVRQTEGRKKRTTSLSHLQHNLSSRRSSIEFIDNGSPISTSKGSLLDTSQDSLVDSGVSTEDSPTNTLSCRRKNKLTKSSSAVNSSGESSAKLPGLNIDNWSEWVESEMGQTSAKHTEPTESSPDCKVATKSPNKFKNVVKQLFSAKKRQNAAQVNEPTTRKENDFTREEKISTV